MHQLLGRQGVRVPSSSLHRFAVKRCGFAERRRITVRMSESPPGELAGDVGILLLLLCDRLGVDFLAIIRAKLEIIAKNYPIDAARGRAERGSE